MLVGILAGCVQIGTFPCDRDSQCTLGGTAGRCFAPGYCAMPDESCDSGYRFHDRGSPDDLAGKCAELLPSGSSSSDSSAGTLPSQSSSSGALESSGGSSSEGSSSHGSSTSTPTDCGDRPCACTISIASGSDHLCAARLDGVVVCWGRNNNGELGREQPSGPMPWPEPILVPGETNFNALVAGNHHTCGFASGNQVWCWGRNTVGEVDPADRSSPLPPRPVVAAETTGQLAVSPQHTCVTSSDTSLFECQGNNAFGEAGVAPPPNGPGPFASLIAKVGPIDQIAAGRDHTCARVGGEVWCWGRNLYGQLGVETPGNVNPDPLPVPLPGPASWLVAGRDHTCVAVDEGDSVLCWGRNIAGQIGDGSLMNASVPTPPVEPLPGKVVYMTARLDVTCALLDTEEVWCWGGDDGNDLGGQIAGDAIVTAPLRIDVIDELPEPLIALAVGHRHLCGVAESMRLWCWGADNLEQQGPIDPQPGMEAVEIDVQCPEGVGQ